MVTFLDTLVAFFSGLVIFPTVFAFGVDAGAGAGLTFITLPAVFSQMWGGALWSALFFSLLFIAALTSAVSLFEVVVSYGMDELRWSRPRASVVMGLAVFLMGIPSALSNGAVDIRLFGQGFLDGLDWLCSNILLTVCGILICLFAGWVVCDKVKSEVTNDGQVPFPLLVPWLWILRVVAPAAIIIIIYSGLK